MILNHKENNAKPKTSANKPPGRVAPVDWKKIPPPEDDGGAAHLVGMVVPRVRLSATDDGAVDVGGLVGLSVIFFYPMTGRPDVPLPEGWDEIPGARGYTPQSCAFRDEYSGLLQHGVGAVFGISTQSTEYQKEAWARLHLPYPLLSDEKLQLTKALNLPTMQVAYMTLIKRITLVLKDNIVQKIFYPVFPPDKNVADVIQFLASS